MTGSRLYFSQRLLLVLPTLVGVTLLGFLLCQAMPGGPIEALFHGSSALESSSSRSAAISAAQRQAMVEYFGFNLPWPRRYLTWAGGLLRGDWGTSYYYFEPVTRVLARALPATLWLGFLSFFFSIGGGVLLGVWQAGACGRAWERGVSLLLAVAAATPAFALAALFLSTFSSGSPFSFLPLQGLSLDGFGPTAWGEFFTHAFLPVLSLSAAPLAVTARTTKEALLLENGKKYLLAARARGLSARHVMRAHALRNALLPLIAHCGNWVAGFFAGSIVIETLFGVNGMGRTAFDSLVRRDYPVALAVVLLCGLAQVVANFAADITLATVDPRVRRP